MNTEPNGTSVSTADPASPDLPVATTASYQLVVPALVRDRVRDRVHGRARTATTVVRYLVATMLLLSVIPKITAHQNEIRQFGRFGLPESSALVCTVATLETLGAVLLIVGLLTRLAAAGLVANMIGAILTAGVHVGGPVHLGLGPVLLVASAYVAWAGPGALALDHRWPHQQPDAAIAIATAVSARAQPCVERRRDSQPRLQNPAPTGRTGQARPCEGVSLPGCTR